MDIYGPGFTYQAAVDVIDTVSEFFYSGNVIVHPDAYDYRGNGRSFRGRILVTDSRGPGSRTSWTGRHGPYACWHAYRDVIGGILALAPDATVRTGIAVYKGEAGFLATYPETAHRNIGSVFEPAYMPDLCQCRPPIRGNDEIHG